MINIGIVGSRKRSERESIKYILVNYLKFFGKITLISGGAKGIDSEAEQIAKEFGEDVAKDLVGSDFACDLAEVVEGLPDVLCDQICWQSALQSFASPFHGLSGLIECLKVTCIGDYNVVFMAFTFPHELHQQTGQIVNIITI